MKTTPASPPRRIAKPKNKAYPLAKTIKSHWKHHHATFMAAATFPTAPGALLSEAYARFRILESGALAGDTTSYRAMAILVARICEFFEVASFVNSDDQRSIARSMRNWPVLISAYPDERETTLREIRKLPLGKNLPELVRPKRPYSLRKRVRLTMRQQTPIKSII